MELTSLPKLLWTSDNKLLHHHFPDVFATVHTTQDIPEEASFGPCMLQNTLLDTVAFIALKCSERRNIHYVFKVSPANSSAKSGNWPSTVLTWRLDSEGIPARTVPVGERAQSMSSVLRQATLDLPLN
ncbi:myosin light chain kinase, smooth muscle-like [Platysternon megacephalum]|uniref:Myosin light chain kinase, smooth muscle-like n=1 Tax=Platysternon megacephalum TaxID=55544 RepID=A0A4D9E4B5_9SAUR|nr:myosin light chain kinase, smooth muscle-like [Platysternon megacephalum]